MAEEESKAGTVYAIRLIKEFDSIFAEQAYSEAALNNEVSRSGGKSEDSDNYSCPRWRSAVKMWQQSSNRPAYSIQSFLM